MECIRCLDVLVDWVMCLLSALSTFEDILRDGSVPWKRAHRVISLVLTLRSCPLAIRSSTGKEGKGHGMLVWRKRVIDDLSSG